MTRRNPDEDEGDVVEQVLVIHEDGVLVDSAGDEETLDVHQWHSLQGIDQHRDKVLDRHSRPIHNVGGHPLGEIQSGHTEPAHQRHLRESEDLVNVVNDIHDGVGGQEDEGELDVKCLKRRGSATLETD